MSSAACAFLQLLSPDRPRAKSLIVTVYGDSVLPFGGGCWLGALIDLVAPLGLNERVTRTAVFRLVQDGILEAERVGRRSRYTLTRIGRRQFDSAQARIYASEPPQRDGKWTLIAMPDALSAAERDALSRELGWLGFARLAPGLLGTARGDAADQVNTVLSELESTEDCVVFAAESRSDGALPGLAAKAWPLEEIAADYSEFLSLFERLRSDAPHLGPEDAFVARTLLIHAYRRALLRDPALPDMLLPERWPGHAARSLARDLYRALQPASQSHLKRVLAEETANGLAMPRFR